MPYSYTRRLATNITPAVLACGLIVICTWNFSWTSRDPVLATHIWVQMVVAIGIASVMVLGVHELNTVNPWVAMFLLVALVAHFFSQYTPPSIGLVLNKKLIFSPATLAFYTILLGVAWYCMIVATFTTVTIRWLLDAMCVIALANMVFLCMQYFGYDPINASSVKPLGLTPNSNHASALLAFCVPAFLRPKWYWVLPPLFLAMVITNGKGGMLAAGCGVFFWLMFIDGNIKWKITGCLLTVFVIYIMVKFLVSGSVKDSFNARYDIWLMAWEKFWHHPWLGYGPGQWQTVLHEEYFIQKSTPSWHARTHNEFLQGAVEMGVPFIVVIIGYFVDIARRLKKHALIPLTALVIIIVNSLVNFPFHVPCVGMIAVAWLAILEVQLREV